jgi:putative GTP pyrophosphokinase
MNEQEEKILKEFTDYKPTLEAWGKSVDEKLLSVLNELDIEHHIKIYPKCRLKNDDSYLSKALYRRKPYTDPILDIEDKIGTRVILLKSDDVYRAASLIQASEFWNAKVTKNLQEIIEEKPNEFDYQSVHIIVWPKEEFEGKSGDELKILCCEVQVRTLLQHAFAEVSHDSTYKGPYKNDKEIIRNLAKSMALMEATDDYFGEIFDIMKDDTRFYRNYLNELVRIFGELYPSFQKETIDVPFTDIIFELNPKNYPISIIEQHVQKRGVILKETISEAPNFIARQPVFLFLDYLAHNHRTVLNSNWPLGPDVLRELNFISGIGTTY